MANGRTVPFAGVAQRRERLTQSGDAGSLPAPRSINRFAPVTAPPLALSAVAMLAAIAVVLLAVSWRWL